MSSSPSDPSNEGLPGAEPPETDNTEADPQESTVERTSALMKDLPEEHRVHDADSDMRVAGKLKAQGVRLRRGMIAPAVFWPSLVLVSAFALFGIFAPDAAGTVLSSTQDWIVSTFGWWYMVVIAAFIVFVLVISFSKYGKIKLGRPEDKPEFSRMSWFTMLFSAGMGVGLMFYGTGEPLIFAAVNPNPSWGEGSPGEMSNMAMAQTYVHWGLHPWAVYAVIGLAVAYAVHRRGRPISIRWALEPIFGERVKGWIGDVIDILAIFGTLFGIATSLGLGAQQIGAGMEVIGLVDNASTNLLMVLIIVITFLATFSVVSGVGAGIKWLSNGNLTLAALLAITALVFGPTVFLMQNLVESLGGYLANVFNMTLDIGAYTRSEEAQSWFADNTLFYWGWWMAWAPFVGVFIARISKGRTVRQFVAGVLLVPTVVGMFWFSVWGGNGLFRQWFGEGDLGDITAEESMFRIFEN